MKFKLGDKVTCKVKTCVGYERVGYVIGFDARLHSWVRFAPSDDGMNYVDEQTHLVLLPKRGRPLGKKNKPKWHFQSTTDEQIVAELKKINEKLDKIFK